jgi:hypothetical protein
VVMGSGHDVASIAGEGVSIGGELAVGSFVIEVEVGVSAT